jgi:phytoene dehydrogenase-like protein
MGKNHYELILVGAGLSALTAAAYLTKAGYSVLVLEKTPTCGGLLNSFSREGYVFDAGPRSIENSGIIRPMLKDLGIEMELVGSPVSIGIESQVINMDSKDSIDSYRQVLEKLYPEAVKDIHKVFRSIDKVYQEMQVIYGFENPVFKNFRKDRKYLFKELLPWLGRFLLAIFRMERMQKPIEDYLEKLSDNQSLVNIIDQHFFKKTPAFFALGYFYVYLDYLYPKGGTGKLPEKLSEKVLENGGKIKVNTTVVTVNPDKKSIQDDKGELYTYDKLVWCADLKSLYRILDTTGLEAKTVASIASKKETLLKGRGGDSVFSLYLGVDKPPQTFSKITKGHLFYTPSRQGLGETHCSELQKLLAKGKKASKEEIKAWLTTYCNLTTYEISIPSLRDENLSPKGKTGLIVSFLLEYDLVRLINEAGWYEEFKLYVETGMIKTLNQSVFAGLLDELSLRFSYTPLSIETKYGCSEGALTGWTFEQPSPAVNKLLKIADSVKTAIPDVLQCGQWAYSPAGIPTAILTGWYAADTLCTRGEKEKRKATGKTQGLQSQKS